MVYTYEERFSRGVSEQYKLFEGKVGNVEKEHVATIYCSENFIKKIVERLNTKW